MQTRALRRELRVGETRLPTPLVVPSYSSRADPPTALEDFIEGTLDSVVGPILVSAYDVFHEPGLRGFDFQKSIMENRPPMVLLDSGGYEALWNANARSAGIIEAADAREWSRESHEAVLNAWPSDIPLVAVTYDNPATDPPAIEVQIAAAAEMAERWPAHASEILLKPPAPAPFLEADTISPFAADLAQFAVIGVTEKECGASMAERVRFLSQLREILDAVDPLLPIHVFGGLDPTMTPLYFWAGADIFDGLSWLRYAYGGGRCLYAQGHITIEMPHEPIDQALWTMRRRNIRELTDLQVRMQRFLTERSESVFGSVGGSLSAAFTQCIAGS